MLAVLLSTHPFCISRRRRLLGALDALSLVFPDGPVKDLVVFKSLPLEKIAEDPPKIFIVWFVLVVEVTHVVHVDCKFLWKIAT